MPTRVMLLVMAILLFVAAWNTDQPNRHRDALPVAATKAPSATKAAIDVPNCEEPLADAAPATLVSLPVVVPAKPTAAPPVSPRKPSIDRWSPLDAISEFLPDDITPGEYRIVTADGQVAALSLTMDDLIYHNRLLGVPARTHYVVETDNQRWHFIRVSETAGVPAPESDELTPAIAARSRFAN